MSETKTASSTTSARFALTDRLVVLAALATIVVTTGAFLLASVWVATSGAYNIRGVDINVIYTLQKIERGFPLYGDPSQPPFELVQYSPLFYILCAAFLKILSIPASDVFGIARTARLLALSFGITTCIVVYFIVSRQLRAHRTSAFMAAACVLIVTYPWFSLARPDSLMLLLLTTSIALGIRLSRCTRDAPALTIGFVGICVLAACAKQNGIVAMVPMLLFLAIEKRWRSLRVSLLLLGVLLALAPVAATALLGHFWKANIVDGLRGGIDFSGTVAKTYGPFFLMFAAFSAAAIATAWQWVIEPHEAELRYVGLCAPVFLAEAMVSGLKFGSAVNYFDEFVIVAAIVLAVSGDRFLCCFNATMLRRAIALFALIFLPMYTFRQVQSYVLGNMNPTHHSLRTLPSAQYSAFNDVGSYLQQHLNNGSYFVSYIQPLCLQLPRQCIVPDPLNVHLASRMRAVDYAALEKLSREHRIQYMILPESVMIEEAFRYQSLPGFDPRTLQLETQVGGAKIYSIRKIGTM